MKLLLVSLLALLLLATHRPSSYSEQQPKVTERTAGKEILPGIYEVFYDTPVYSEPNEYSPRVSRIEAGTQVNIVGILGDWLEIRSKHGRPPGFIRKDSVIPIEVGRLPEKQTDSLSEPQQKAKERDVSSKVKSSAVTYGEVVKSHRGMTTAQFKSYVSGLKGKEMEGEGRIGDVTEKWPPWGPKPIPGVYKAYIFMSERFLPEKGRVGGADIILELPTSAAMGLQRGQPVKFRGRIESVESRGRSCCQITLLNGIVLNTQ